MRQQRLPVFSGEGVLNFSQVGSPAVAGNPAIFAHDLLTGRL
jgi:hypothetical protein